MAVQGPKARERVAALDERFATVPRFGVIRFDYEGVEVRVAGTGYTGEDGLEIAVPNEKAEAVLAALVMIAGFGMAAVSGPVKGCSWRVVAGRGERAHMVCVAEGGHRA